MAFFIGLSKTAEDEKKKLETPVSTTTPVPTTTTAASPAPSTTDADSGSGSVASSSKAPAQLTAGVSQAQPKYLDVNRSNKGAYHAIGQIPEGTDTVTLPSGITVPIDFLGAWGWDSPRRGSYTNESAAYWNRWTEVADELATRQANYMNDKLHYAGQQLFDPNNKQTEWWRDIYRALHSPMTSALHPERKSELWRRFDPEMSVPMQDIPNDRYDAPVAPNDIYEVETTPNGLATTYTPEQLKRMAVSEHALMRNYAAWIMRERHMLPEEMRNGLQSIGLTPVFGDNDVEDQRWGSGIEKLKLMSPGGRINVDSDNPELQLAYRNEWLRRSYYSRLNESTRQWFEKWGKNVQSPEDWASLNGWQRSLIRMSAEQLKSEYSPASFERTMSEADRLGSRDQVNLLGGDYYIPVTKGLPGGWKAPGLSDNKVGLADYTDYIYKAGQRIGVDKARQLLKMPSNARWDHVTIANRLKDLEPSLMSPAAMPGVDIMLADLAAREDENSPMAYKNQLLINGIQSALGRQANEKATDYDAAQYVVRNISDGWTPLEAQLAIKLFSGGKYDTLAHLLTGENGAEHYQRLKRDIVDLYGENKAKEYLNWINGLGLVGYGTGVGANVIAGQMAKRPLAQAAARARRAVSVPPSALAVNGILPGGIPAASQRMYQLFRTNPGLVALHAGNMFTRGAVEAAYALAKGNQAAKAVNVIGNAFGIGLNPGGSIYGQDGAVKNAFGGQVDGYDMLMANNLASRFLPGGLRRLSWLALPEIMSFNRDPSNYRFGQTTANVVDSVVGLGIQNFNKPERIALNLSESTRAKLRWMTPKNLQEEYGINLNTPFGVDSLTLNITGGKSSRDVARVAVATASTNPETTLAILQQKTLPLNDMLDVFRAAVGAAQLYDYGATKPTVGYSGKFGESAFNYFSGDGWQSDGNAIAAPNIRALVGSAADSIFGVDGAGKLTQLMSRDDDQGEYLRTLGTYVIDAGIRSRLEGSGGGSLDPSAMQYLDAMVTAMPQENLDAACQQMVPWIIQQKGNGTSGKPMVDKSTLDGLPPRLVESLAKYVTIGQGVNAAAGGDATSAAAVGDTPADVNKATWYAMARGFKNGISELGKAGFMPALIKQINNLKAASNGRSIPSGSAKAVGEAVSTAAKQDPRVVTELLLQLAERSGNSKPLGQNEINVLLGINPDDLFSNMDEKTARLLFKFKPGAQLDINGTDEQKQAVAAKIDAIHKAAENRVRQLAKDDPVKNLPLLAGLYLHSKDFGELGEFLSDPANFYLSAAVLLAGGAGLTYCLFSDDEDEEEEEENGSGRKKAVTDEQSSKDRVNNILEWKKVYE